jgi:signal transduction histidine kinase
MSSKRSAVRDTSFLHRIRIFRTESFRLAALFATLLFGLAWVLMGVVYWIVNDTQTSALVGAVDSDINTIRNGYLGKGLPEAIEVVQQRLGPHDSNADSLGVDSLGVYVLLQERVKGKLAGNLPSSGPLLGLFSFSRPRALPAKDHEDRHGPKSRVTILGRGSYIGDGVYLFVGRDTAQIAATTERISKAFAWIAGATLAFAVGGGIFFSVQFMRRIDAITRTCRAIVAGKFNDRIALRGSGDELDGLAAAINDMLDRISALLDNLRQVSSDVAHDLRSPLTRLRNRLEETRVNSVTTGDYASAVSGALEDTDRLLAIFAALLRISQIESGTRVAAFSEVSLSEILENIYEMYRPVAEDQHQSLTARIEKNLLIRGDAELLTQMFSNLIENAIRHTPRNTNIVISLEATETAVVASISDDGDGIPPREREKVFRRFYRLTSSRSTPGNGLGLALVAAIANLHHAKIEIFDNHPGSSRPGSSFRTSF